MAKWNRRREIRSGQALLCDVTHGDRCWHWWVCDGSNGTRKTEAAAKRAAERALVKYGRRLVKAGGGE